MRLAEHLGKTVTELLRDMPIEEQELWELRELGIGTLGQRRKDLLVASIAQAALMPHLKDSQSIDKFLVFGERNWRPQAQIDAENQSNTQRVLALRARQERVKQRFEQLLKAGRMDDWAKETGPNGEWLGPITDSCGAV